MFSSIPSSNVPLGHPGFEGLVDERRKEDLQLLYQLFQRVDALLPLRDAFSAAIKVGVRVPIP